MATDNSLQIRLNGERHLVPVGVNVVEMLREIGIDPQRVAVERNLQIVPRSALEEVSVEDGDEFEIVHFVGGG